MAPGLGLQVGAERVQFPIGPLPEIVPQHPKMPWANRCRGQLSGVRASCRPGPRQPDPSAGPGSRLDLLVLDGARGGYEECRPSRAAKAVSASASPALALR